MHHNASIEAIQKTLTMWQRTLDKLENELAQAETETDRTRIQRQIEEVRQRLCDVEEQLATRSKQASSGINITPMPAAMPGKPQLSGSGERELLGDRERLQALIEKFTGNLAQVEQELSTQTRPEQRKMLQQRISRDTALLQQYRLRLAAVEKQLEQ